MAKKPNLLFFGIDSLRRNHMSHFGYGRLTTPHISKYAEGGVTFDNCFSAHIPTTPGYSNMMTGRDCFGTDVVALSQKAIIDGVPVLAEILRDNGYNTTCVGFQGNAGGRGYDTYLSFAGWGPDHDDGRAHKAENLNDVAIPELERLAKEDKPFMLFLRHMDPHSPYLAPAPFDNMFFQGDAFDPDDKRMQKVYDFKPFGDYIKSWVPEGCTNPDYVVAQYDGAVAYMDSCIQQILTKLHDLGLEEDTIVIFVSDHGETLYDHDCYFDHHSIYDNVLNVPFAFKYAKFGYEGHVDTITQEKDILPTILSLAGIDCGIRFDGRDMTKAVTGEGVREEPEFYITEATWMRKHGWRTPEWKLMIALEPDFHFKPEIELYNLIEDPGENHNIAEENPDVVAFLRARMEAHIAKREAEVGHPDPIYTNLDWSGFGRPFVSSQEAYDNLHIGDPAAAQKLQDKLKEMGVED